MSCLRVSVSPAPLGRISISGKASRAAVKAVFKKTHILTFDPNRKALLAAVAVPQAKLSVRLICKVGTGNYLRVTPAEAMWITVDRSINYDIKSNTDWIIV